MFVLSIKIIITMSNSQTTLFSKPVLNMLKWFGIGAAVFSVGYLTYKKITNKPGSNQLSNPENSKSRQRIQTQMTNKSEYSDFYFDKSLEAELIEAFLGDPDSVTLQQIFIHSPKIARDQYIKFTKEIRKRRRLIRKFNEDQYVNLILNYEEEIDELMERSRLELAEYLKIEPEELDQMQKCYEGEDIRELYRVAEKNLHHQMIEYCPTKKITDETLWKILEDQIGFVKNKLYQRIHQNLLKEVNIGQNKILKIVMALFEDIIYDKYGYQWEDIEKKLLDGRFSENKTVLDRNKFVKMMQADIGDFNYESLSSEDDKSESDIQGKMSIHTAEMSGNFENVAQD